MRPQYYMVSDGGDSTQRFFTRARWPFTWSVVPTIVPRRLRRKLRSTISKIQSGQTPTSSINALQTSFNPADTVKLLRAHHRSWSYYNVQYFFLVMVGIFLLYITKSPGPLVRFTVAALLIFSLILPITRQFFLPFLPIAAWLLFFHGCQFIPGEHRPPISVQVLPALENILYGANISNILSAHKSTILDILAWLPYGVMHFGAPAVCSALIFLFSPPGSAPVFAKAFGYMNFTGVLIQICFPCSPPWYENKYGLAPANYSMSGSPAGLVAIDKLLGIQFYTSTFTASPMVFGAFPSLHSGCATIEALFMSHFFPKLRPLFLLYVLWLWWAAMYLSHHYAVDLVAGSLLAVAAFFIARAHSLPRLQPGKSFRWDYDYVEYGEFQDVYSYEHATAFTADKSNHFDSEEWNMDSSFSVASTSRSSSISGVRTSADQGLDWDRETIASHPGGNAPKYD